MNDESYICKVFFLISLMRILSKCTKTYGQRVANCDTILNYCTSSDVKKTFSVLLQYEGDYKATNVYINKSTYNKREYQMLLYHVLNLCGESHTWNTSNHALYTMYLYLLVMLVQYLEMVINDWHQAFQVHNSPSAFRHWHICYSLSS